MSVLSITTSTREVGEGLVFTQFCPLFKGGPAPAGKEGYVDGIASAEARDRQREILVQKGMDWSYHDSDGVLNEDHDNSPGKVLGEPVRRYPTTYVTPDGVEVPATGLETMLYLSKSRARDAWETIVAQMSNPHARRRMGYSIEGVAVERDPFDRLRVTKSKITNVALTQHPMFPGARLVRLAKSMNAIGEQSPAGLGEGTYSALAGQDLEGAPVDVVDTAAAMATSKQTERLSLRQLQDLITQYHPALSKAQTLVVAKAIFAQVRANKGVPR